MKATTKKPAPLKSARAPSKVVVANDPADQKGELKAIGGSKSDNWNNILVNQVTSALWMAHSDDETRQKQRMATVGALIGIAPVDEIEGMMAAQMVAAHNAAMECYRRSMIQEQTFEGRRENLAQANKLSRTCTTLVEALNRHRGKGQQKVTVEHVHVHAGGQAVVGSVTMPGQPRGGGSPETQEQPHAKSIAGEISNACEPAMWCPNAIGEAVPVAGYAERAMPDARRTVTGGTKGKSECP